MPAAIPYTEAVGAAIIKRHAAGEGLAAICGRDGIPTVIVVQRWAWTVPHFGRRLRVAREAFRRLRLARRRPREPTPDLLTLILARIESGESRKRICGDPGMPLEETVVGWLGSDPDFAGRYRAAVACRKAQRPYTPRGYSEEIAAEICARLARHESLNAICKDPRMPSMKTVYRWRRGLRHFDRRCQQATHNLGRVSRPSVYSRALEEEIFDRLAAGEPLNAICREPGMPCRQTIQNWLDASSPFASRYIQAREAAQELWDDELRAAINSAPADGSGSHRIVEAMRRPKPHRSRKYRP